MFLMSLAIADLTVGTIVMPISSAYAITGTNEMAQIMRKASFPLRVIFGAINYFYQD